ncbi:MAG: hypothetical protein HYX41_06070 [Bdellovibrio sp.]|nr:hypothetical protein [Bdellovibrio sp.]
MIFPIWILLEVSKALAVDTLPYSTRTNSYSGWNTTIQGDLSSIGMGGSTIGLGESFLDATDNPAGLAMTSNDANLNLAENIIYDGNIQNMANAMNAANVAVALSTYPWGLGLCYRSRVLEGQSYNLPTDATSVNYTLRTGDLYLSGARLFLNDRLSVGVSLVLASAEERAEMPGSTFSNPGQTWGFGFGASWLFPHHLLLGANISPSLTYQFSAPKGTAPPLNNFLQSIQVPTVLAVGLGWLPNRFFKAGFTLDLFGTSNNVALLRDDSIMVGQSVTVQPRLGASYRFVDFRNFSATLNLGTYYETSRINGAPDRMHFTTSIGVSPWIFDLGLGLDTSFLYNNYIFAVGLNVVKTLAALNLVPIDHHPSGGFLPKPFHYSTVGLPRAFSENYQPKPGPSAVEIALAVPQKIAEAFKIHPKEHEPAHKHPGHHRKRNHSKRKISPPANWKHPDSH